MIPVLGRRIALQSTLRRYCGEDILPIRRVDLDIVDGVRTPRDGSSSSSCGSSIVDTQMSTVPLVRRGIVPVSARCHLHPFNIKCPLLEHANGTSNLPSRAKSTRLSSIPSRAPRVSSWSIESRMGVLEFGSRLKRNVCQNPLTPMGIACSDSARVGAAELTPLKTRFHSRNVVFMPKVEAKAPRVWLPAHPASAPMSMTTYPGRTPSTLVG